MPVVLHPEMALAEKSAHRSRCSSAHANGIRSLDPQVNEAAEIIYDMVDPNANLIFGAVVDSTLPDDTVSITIIATGVMGVREAGLARWSGQAGVSPKGAAVLAMGAVFGAQSPGSIALPLNGTIWLGMSRPIHIHRLRPRGARAWGTGGPWQPRCCRRQPARRGGSERRRSSCSCRQRG